MTIADINLEIRAICEGTSSTDLLDDATLLRRVNRAYEEIVALIQGCDGLWQFDDTNYTDFPEGTTTLVASQSDYTFAADVLEVEGVSVLDSGGNWQKLIPIDESQMGVDPAEFSPTAGLPVYYDKKGRSIILYPAPASGSVTLASGLKVFFKRTASVYTSAEVTTGTKQPGFAVAYHLLLVYKASLAYCVAYKPKIVPFITSEITRLEEGIGKHYGRREQDRRKRLTMGGVNYL